MSAEKEKEPDPLDAAMAKVGAALPEGFGAIIFIVNERGDYVMNSNIEQTHVTGILRSFLEDDKISEWKA